MILHILQMDDRATPEEIPMDVMNHQQAERDASRKTKRTLERDVSFIQQ